MTKPTCWKSIHPPHPRLSVCFSMPPIHPIVRADRRLPRRRTSVRVLDAHDVQHAAIVGTNTGYGSDSGILLDALKRGDGRFKGGRGCRE